MRFDHRHELKKLRIGLFLVPVGIILLVLGILSYSTYILFFSEIMIGEFFGPIFIGTGVWQLYEAFKGEDKPTGNSSPEN